MLTLSFDPFPSLQTGRLSLREITRDDADEIFFLRSDAEMLRYLDREPAKSVEDAVKWITMIGDFRLKADAITWAISLKDNKKLIGTITLWNIQKEHHRAEVGYVLHSSFQRQGIMQEAMEVVLDYGFKTMKLHSIEANVNPANDPSIRLLERNHFVREAYFRENFYYNGKYLDSAIYSLINPF